LESMQFLQFETLLWVLTLLNLEERVSEQLNLIWWSPYSLIIGNFISVNLKAWTGYSLIVSTKRINSCWWNGIRRNLTECYDYEFFTFMRILIGDHF
jgi:hypothetical protein